MPNTWHFRKRHSTLSSLNTSSIPYRARKQRWTNSRACCRPGGEIILVNRVGAEAGARRTLEHLFTPVAERLGWRSEFPWERFAHWIQQTEGLRLIERRPVPPLGHFSLIRFGKTASRADIGHASQAAE